jgi:hypothetical protein
MEWMYVASETDQWRFIVSVMNDWERWDYAPLNWVEEITCLMTRSEGSDMEGKKQLNNIWWYCKSLREDNIILKFGFQEGFVKVWNIKQRD